MSRAKHSLAAEHSLAADLVEQSLTERTLEGHSATVLSVAFSPDGTHVISGSCDKSVRMWNVETVASVRTFQGHEDSVAKVAYSLDGMRIVSASNDKTVRVYSAETGECEQTLRGHEGSVTSVAISPDGKRVVSGAYDEVKIWNVEIESATTDGTHEHTGICIRTLRDYACWILCLAFSPDGTCVAGGLSDRTLRVWNVETGVCTLTLEGHSDWVNSVAFSSDGTRIASGSSDQTLRVWNVTTSGVFMCATCELVIQDHSDQVTSVAFSHDGTCVASGSYDETLRIYNVGSGRCIRTFEIRTYVTSVAFSPTGEWIACGMGTVVKMWRFESDVNASSKRLQHSHLHSLAKRLRVSVDQNRRAMTEIDFLRTELAETEDQLEAMSL